MLLYLASCTINTGKDLRDAVDFLVGRRFEYFPPSVLAKKRSLPFVGFLVLLRFSDLEDDLGSCLVRRQSKWPKAGLSTYTGLVIESPYRSRAPKTRRHPTHKSHDVLLVVPYEVKRVRRAHCEVFGVFWYRRGRDTFGHNYKQRK